MKNKNNQIKIEKRINLGHMPLFIQLCHQQLEKSKPEAHKVDGAGSTYILPLDILRLTISDPRLYKDIDSIEVIYA